MPEFDWPGLAVNGGAPVRDRPWPPWPRVTERAQHMLSKALASGRWTVSGAYTGAEPFERRFARAFAAFHDRPYCVPTCNGSAALVIALEALGVGPGREVLVPGLTWVACASAVRRVGAVPILVDINPDTLCLSTQAAERALTSRTAAIMAVHLFGSACDIDAFTDLCNASGCALLEDCSQAHGGTWRGKRLGSFGAVAAFSFQQTKLLTSGEGGAVITSDTGLYDKLQQLRADGRRYVDDPVVGCLDLEEVGTIQGHNYCLSEFHAALALEGLERLDEENAARRANVEHLRALLDDVSGVSIQGHPKELDGPVYYHLCLRFDPTVFLVHDIDWLARALSAELALPAIDPVDTPLNSNVLYDPLQSPRTPGEVRARVDRLRVALPEAEQARRTCLTIPHRALLGPASDMQDIVRALRKIRPAAAAQARG